MKRILIASDGSQSAINAAEYGIAYATHLNADIALVSVTDYSIGNMDAGISPKEIEDTGQAQAKAHVKDLLSRHGDLNIVEFEPIGRPDLEINKVIDDWQADLLIIGHHTHHFWEKILFKNLEHKIMSVIKIPLMIIPKDFHLR